MSMFDQSNVGKRTKRVVIHRVDDEGMKWQLSPKEPPPLEFRALLSAHSEELVAMMAGRPVALVVQWSEGDRAAEVRVLPQIPACDAPKALSNAELAALSKLYETFTLPFPELPKVGQQ
jgi:hypothetical protein